MTKQRADIGFGSSFDEFKADEWKPAPKQTAAKPKPPREVIRKVAQESGFNSREATPVLAPVAPAPVQPLPEQGRVGRRVHRTGRDVQLNLKVRGEDRTLFDEICEQNNWVQGLTFQHAIEALSRELKMGQQPLPLGKSA